MPERATVLTLREKAPDVLRRQSQEKEEYKQRLVEQFRKAASLRHRSYHQFNNQTLIEYINTNHDLIIGRVRSRDQEGWRSNTSTQQVRNKFIVVLASLLSQLIQPEIHSNKANDPDSEKIARMMQELLKEEYERGSYFKQYLNMLIECVSQGTVFIETGYKEEWRKIKEIIKKDMKTGKLTFKEKEILNFKGLYNVVVPVDEVYLGNMFAQDMVDQPYIFRRQKVDYFHAERLYGNHADFELVQPFTSTNEGEDDEPDHFELFTHDDLNAGEVELIIYQSRPDDEMAILANGILLTEPGSPLPYDHKDYSLVKGIFSPFDTRFAYGKSLAAEQMFNQEVADTLLNMLIDKTYLSIFPPLVSKGRDHITSDVIVPGSITPVDEDADVTTIGTVGQPVNGSETALLGLVRNLQDESTPPEAGRAQTDQGGRVTARQVIAQQQESARLLGLFGFTIAFLIEDLARLQLQNLLDFVLPQDLTDEQEELADKAFILRNRQVFKERVRGSMLIRPRAMEEQPTEKEMLIEEEELEKRMGQPVQVIYIDPESVRDYDLFVTVKANPQERHSDALKKALELEFFTTFNGNPLINQERLVRNLIEVFDKNPEEYVAIPQTQGLAPEQVQGQTGRISNQIQAPNRPLREPLGLQQLLAQ